MALTESEEAKLRTIITAFEGGQQVDDLPLATDAVQDKKIEVFDDKTGASGKMDLRQAVRMSNAPSCGRVWNLDNSTPRASTWVGSLEMLRNLHEVLGLGCYLVKNDHSRRKLDPTNHYRFDNGETAKLDGSMGHYNWGWGKKFYLAIYRIGNLLYKEVSLAPIPGQYNYVIPVGSISAHGFAALDRTTGALVSYVNDDVNYRGGDSTNWDGTYRTLIGRAATNKNTEYWRAAARKNGSGWLCTTMRHTSVIKILFEIIFGTQDMQAGYNANKDADGLYQGGLGSGVTNMPDWGGYNGYRPFLPTSVGVELGDACGISTYNVLKEDGSVHYAAPVPVFFGLKNPFGYLWRQMDDEFVRCNADTSVTHLVAPSIYGNWTIGNEAGMVAYTTSPTRCEGYIKTLSYDNLENFPTQVGATSSTYHADYFWNTSGATSGFRLCLRGCNADSGVLSGASALYVSSAVSGADVYWGSPLASLRSKRRMAGGTSVCVGGLKGT